MSDDQQAGVQDPPDDRNDDDNNEDEDTEEDEGERGIRGTRRGAAALS